MMDLHSYRTRYESAKRNLAKSNLRERNKEFIFKFEEYLSINGLGLPRLIKYLDKLRQISRWLDKDFNKVTKRDIEKLFVLINNRDYTKSTKLDYSIIVKRFYKWLLGNDEEHPEQVKWLKTTLKLKDKPLPSQADLITPEEVDKLVGVARHPRNKAFVSLLYETGCRIGELANLTIGNVMFDQYGCVINVNGKTGPRRVRVVNSTNYLTQWMDLHPFKDDRSKPLWVNFGGKNFQKQMRYNMIRVLLKDLFARAGIKKKCNPHLFRHSRATFLANHMTEAQMKAYFGWVQHSDMASIYVHLSGRDTDKAILELNGITSRKEEEIRQKPKKCPKCGFINNHTSNYCSRCSGILDLKTTLELQNQLLEKDVQHNKVGDLMGALLKDNEFKEMMFRKMAEIGFGKNLG